MLPPDSVLLDTARPTNGSDPGGLLFSRPLEILTAHTAAEVDPLLYRLDREAVAGRWLAGFIAYEAAYGLSTLGLDALGKAPPLLAWFGVYDTPHYLTEDDVVDLLGRRQVEVKQPRFALDPAEYARRVARIRELIREGDCYQVNLTAPLHFELDGDPLALYAGLRRKQRVPYGAAIRVGDRFVFSLSPELFVGRQGDRLVARPMKGTAARGASAREDREQARRLAASEKDRAENVMIVDLLRNDLSRIARPGTVRVPSLFDVECYETLWQMTSTIEAEANDGVGVSDVLQALFPCGSVTGAPKRRAMRRIAELELDSRGVYCGAIGVLRPGGDFTFSVPIRTIEIDGRQGRMGIGSGIVWDSEPDAEYRECLLKARFLTDPAPPDFELLETMRAEGGAIRLLDLHLARLADSAEYFGFTFDERSIRAALAGLGPGEERVRLTLPRSGRHRIEVRPIDDEPPSTAIVFPEPVSAADPFLRHKTTHRELYKRALAWARDRGADEAILIDENSRVVEGTFTNVWIEREGMLLTPREDVGGLAGIYREHLLAENAAAAEAELTIEDLRSADAVLLSNAVRGLFHVDVIWPPV